MPSMHVKQDDLITKKTLYPEDHDNLHRNNLQQLKSSEWSLVQVYFRMSTAGHNQYFTTRV